ncbi:MAG: hypothetical protein ACI9TH_001527, partial [Kiritimatiellia bacterium]
NPHKQRENRYLRGKTQKKEKPTYTSPMRLSTEIYIKK